MESLDLAVAVILRLATPAIVLGVTFYAWRRTGSRAVMALGIAVILVPGVLRILSRIVRHQYEQGDGWQPDRYSVGEVVAFSSALTTSVRFALLAALVYIVARAVSRSTEHAEEVVQ